MKSERFAALSVLLEYPSDGLETSARLFPRFSAYWLQTPLAQLRQTYVQTFDLRKEVSLYLTYPVLGDTRERGVELAYLKALYRSAGFEAIDSELPDYLPLILDFCSRASDEQVRHVLREVRAGIEALHRGLTRIESPYAHLTNTLRALAPKADKVQSQKAREFAENGAPMELVGR